ncbi:4Fe-4S binding protein [Paenibacillus polymyxa]
MGGLALVAMAIGHSVCGVLCPWGLVQSQRRGRNTDPRT